MKNAENIEANDSDEKYLKRVERNNKKKSFIIYNGQLNDKAVIAKYKKGIHLHEKVTGNQLISLNCFKRFKNIFLQIK